jgi:hypothetical protein
MTRGTEETAGWQRTESHLCTEQWRQGGIILCRQWDQGVKLTIRLRALSKMWNRDSPITLHGTVISEAEEQLHHTVPAAANEISTNGTHSLENICTGRFRAVVAGQRPLICP